MPAPTHAFRSAGPPVRRFAVLALGWLLGAAAPAAAQLPDPFVVPRGALRLGFEPVYTNYDRLFNQAGDEFPLGAFFSADSLGTAHLPTLTPAELAVRAITRDGSFRFNLGALRARLDADIRRLPFTLGLGLTRWLSFTATVPLVTTRVNATVRLDSTGANAGWNQITSAGSDPGALDSLLTLLSGLEAAAAQLEAGIAGGSYGCPSSAQCDQARDLVARARDLAANLSALAGVPGLVSGDGTAPAPPFAPLETSPAGAAIRGAIEALSAELQTFGLAGLSGRLPLPTTGADSNAVDQVMTDPDFGYGAAALTPPRTVKLSGIGDIELGLRVALAQGERVRAVLGAMVRLPTGKRDDPNDFLDLGNGDHQTDLIWTLDASLEPWGRLGLWLSAAYTLQMADRLDRRIAPPDRPLAPASMLATVDRNLGDLLRVSAHPAFRLAPDFRAFVSAAYEKKWADRFSRDGTPIPELETFTGRETWAFGAGLLYRVDQGRVGSVLPIEASLSYQAAFFGKGGATPKAGRFALALRLYYNLWGDRPPTAPPPSPTPQQ
jgi:hypothetical protein